MQKNQQKQKSSALVFRFVKDNLWLFGLGLLCSMLNTVFNSLTPQIIRVTVDSVIGSAELPGWVTALGLGQLAKSQPAKMLILAAAAVLIPAVLSGLFSFFARFQTAKASENSIKALRDELYGHIQKLPFSWHTAHQTGEIPKMYLRCRCYPKLYQRTDGRGVPNQLFDSDDGGNHVFNECKNFFGCRCFCADHHVLFVLLQL